MLFAGLACCYSRLLVSPFHYPCSLNHVLARDERRLPRRFASKRFTCLLAVGTDTSIAFAGQRKFAALEEQSALSCCAVRVCTFGHLCAQQTALAGRRSSLSPRSLGAKHKSRVTSQSSGRRDRRAASPSHGGPRPPEKRTQRAPEGHERRRKPRALERRPAHGVGRYDTGPDDTPHAGGFYRISISDSCLATPSNPQNEAYESVAPQHQFPSTVLSA